MIDYSRYASNHLRFDDAERRQALEEVEMALCAFAELLDLLDRKGGGEMPRAYRLLKMVFDMLAGTIEFHEAES